VTATVEIAAMLDTAPDRVWAEVQRPALLMHVAAPMVRFRPVDPAALPDVWGDGPHVLSMALGGVLPLGRQVIDISRPAPSGAVRFLRDDGSSAQVRRWDHLISVAPERDGTRYVDRVEIEAGWRTPVVAAFARRFYRHRQRRLRALAAAGFDYGAAA
jgi:hypothetical protein